MLKPAALLALASVFAACSSDPEEDPQTTGASELESASYPSAQTPPPTAPDSTAAATTPPADSNTTLPAATPEEAAPPPEP